MNKSIGQRVKTKALRRLVRALHKERVTALKIAADILKVNINELMPKNYINI